MIEGPEKRFFEAEYLPKIRHSEPGLLSMVSLGDNLIGSQFFFTLSSDLTSLDGIHVVIGRIVEGLEVLRTINETICDNTHRPYKDVRITHTVILDDPFENPRGFREPSRSPSPTPERLRGGRIAADEDIDDAAGKTEAELAEIRRDREAKARATILEIIGDLPDAEIAPPENVLFVCKLNNVTTDDDLEIIFSRFGKIIGCEVIRDRKTGDSLQYAFIEFEDKKACEMAYFKMDNVLIDDRRIHVDFSQSVSRLQWRGKGRGIIIKDGNENNKLDFDNYKKPIEDRRGKGQRNDSDRRDVGRQQYRDNRRDDSRRNDFNNRRQSRSPRRPRFDNRRGRGSFFRNDRWRDGDRNRDRQRSRSRSRNRYNDRRDNNRRDRNRSSPDRSSERRGRDERHRSNDRNRDERHRSVDKNRHEKHRSVERNRDDRHRSIERSRDEKRQSVDRNRDERRFKRDDDRRMERDQRSRSTEKHKEDKYSKKSKKSKSKNKKEKKSKKKKKSSKKHKKHSSSDSSSSGSDSSSSSSSSP